MSTATAGTRVKPFSIIIKQTDFMQNLRPLLIASDRFAQCRVRRRETTSSTELILDPWSETQSLPNGQTMPPLSDWGVATMVSDGSTPERLIERLQPKRSQLVVAICLKSTDYRMLPVAIYDQGAIVRPESVRFIGSGLLTLPESKPSQKHTLRESRTVGALRSQFDRMKTLSIILVGAGRGGYELARQLVSIGLRRLIMIDGDRIGPENLDAMPMVGSSDLNELKVFQLARSLRRNQPELTVSCIPHSILHANAIRAVRESRVDAAISFVDSDPARLAVSRLCQESEMVHMDVGTLVQWTPEGTRRMSADVRLFEPRRGCVACVPLMESLDDVLYEIAAPEGALHRGRPMAWNELRAGSLLHLNAAASSLAIETWLGWLAGKYSTSHWARMFWNEFETPEFQSGPVGPSGQCLFCNGSN